MKTRDISIVEPTVGGKGLHCGQIHMVSLSLFLRWVKASRVLTSIAVRALHTLLLNI